MQYCILGNCVSLRVFNLNICAAFLSKEFLTYCDVYCAESYYVGAMLQWVRDVNIIAKFSTIEV